MNNLALMLVSNANAAERTKQELAKVFFDTMVSDSFANLESMLKTSTPSLMVIEDRHFPSPTIEHLSALIRTSGIPVMVLSSEMINGATALDCGALECASLQAEEAEFNARVRHGARLAATLFPAPGELKLSENNRLRYRDHKLIGSASTIHLGYLETQLLLALGSQPGKPVSREILCHAAWRRSLLPGDRRLDIRVVALNQKLREATAGQLSIRGVRNAGYRLQTTDA